MDMEEQLLRPLLGDPEDRLNGEGTDSQKSEQHVDKNNTDLGIIFYKNQAPGFLQKHEPIN